MPARRRRPSHRAPLLAQARADAELTESTPTPPGRDAACTRSRRRSSPVRSALDVRGRAAASAAPRVRGCKAGGGALGVDVRRAGTPRRGQGTDEDGAAAAGSPGLGLALVVDDYVEQQRPWHRSSWCSNSAANLVAAAMDDGAAAIGWKATNQRRLYVKEANMERSKYVEAEAIKETLGIKQGNVWNKARK